MEIKISKDSTAHSRAINMSFININLMCTKCRALLEWEIASMKFYKSSKMMSQNVHHLNISKKWEFPEKKSVILCKKHLLM